MEYSDEEMTAVALKAWPKGRYLLNDECLLQCARNALAAPMVQGGSHDEFVVRLALAHPRKAVLALGRDGARTGTGSNGVASTTTGYLLRQVSFTSITSTRSTRTPRSRPSSSPRSPVPTRSRQRGRGSNKLTLDTSRSARYYLHVDNEADTNRETNMTTTIAPHTFFYLSFSGSPRERWAKVHRSCRNNKGGGPATREIQFSWRAAAAEHLRQCAEVRQFGRRAHEYQVAMARREREMFSPLPR